MNWQNDVTDYLQCAKGKNLLTWNIVIKYLQAQSIHSHKIFDRESLFTDTKIKYFKILYLIYITYLSPTTWYLLRVHVLNKYHHKHILMSSYSSRGLIPKKWGFFLLCTVEWERSGYLGLEPVIFTIGTTQARNL